MVHKITTKQYEEKINAFNIANFGFDTHSRVLGLSADEVKFHWNELTNGAFKRIPRTEYQMRFLPEYSTKLKPYWMLELNKPYLMLYITPTAPILVPNGFITDKGSIPFVFRNIISHDDREMMPAYLFHDRACEVPDMTRFTTDGLLYEVGTIMDANWLKKNLVYSVVRAAAWLPSKDKIRNGVNVSLYNRGLIKEADQHFHDNYLSSHLDSIKSLGK